MDGWWSYFDCKKGREVKGDGFQVTVYPLCGIRYSTRDRHVTLDTRSIDETEELGRRWLLFPNIRLLIVVPSRLKWDGAEALESAESENVKARISWALEKIGQRYSYEVDDENYARLDQEHAKSVAELGDGYWKT